MGTLSKLQLAYGMVNTVLQVRALTLPTDCAPVNISGKKKKKVNYPSNGKVKGSEFTLLKRYTIYLLMLNKFSRPPQLYQ